MALASTHSQPTPRGQFSKNFTSLAVLCLAYHRCLLQVQVPQLCQIQAPLGCALWLRAGFQGGWGQAQVNSNDLGDQEEPSEGKVSERTGISEAGRGWVLTYFSCHFLTLQFSYDHVLLSRPPAHKTYYWLSSGKGGEISPKSRKNGT